MGQTLRDYQSRGIAQIFDAWKQGARSVLCVLPTGGGKTTQFCWIAHQIQPARTLINVHRRELATQASNRLHEFRVPHGFIMAGEPRTPYAPVQIATVQTLIRRAAPDAQLVVNDEAHLSTAKTWTKILEQYPSARILGVTATPWRLSGKPLSSLYDATVVVATPRELREQGHLCPYQGFAYRTPDLSGVKTTGGDYNERQSAEVMRQSAIVDNIVEMWLQHSSDRSTIVFCVTVEHSKQVTEKFRAAGVRAEHLDGSTPLEQRKAILQRVERGETQVLCNVGVAVEGLDIPRVKCIVLARPTQSLSRALQMMGRGFRPWNGVTCRIHDHAFVIQQHGLPDDDRDYSLEAAKEKPDVESPESLTQCKKCFALYRGSSCSACAEPRPIGERVIRTVDDAEIMEFSSDAPQAQRPVEVKWTNVGRVLEGVLLQRWDVPTNWGKQRFYQLRGPDRLYNFPAPTQLNARLVAVPDGVKVRITFIEETDLGNGRARKEFRVQKATP